MNIFSKLYWTKCGKTLKIQKKKILDSLPKQSGNTVPNSVIIIIIIGMIGHLDAIPERASSMPWTGGSGWALEVVWK